MIDATRLLDMLVGGGAAAPGQAPHQSYTQMPAPYGQPQPPQQQASGGGDLLARAKDMLGGAAGSLPSGFGGGVAGGVAAGAITSLLLGSKGGRKFAGEALKLGAAAALGGLAYRAYANYKAGAPVAGGAAHDSSTYGSGMPAAAAATTAPVAPSPLPAATPANEQAMLLVRAMIAAALSDGTLDDSERAMIVGRLEAAGITAEEQQFLAKEMARPWSPAQFAAAAETPEQRAEVYLAAALAIEADTAAERAYLAYLAATLGLEAELVRHLEGAVAQAKAPAGPVAEIGVGAGAVPQVGSGRDGAAA